MEADRPGDEGEGTLPLLRLCVPGVRLFVEQGFELLVAQSYAKNFGLYGERAGCFHFVAAPVEGQEVAGRVASQLAILQRSEISNPPAYGARIASRVLNDPRLFAM